MPENTGKPDILGNPPFTPGYVETDQQLAQGAQIATKNPVMRQTDMSKIDPQSPIQQFEAALGQKFGPYETQAQGAEGDFKNVLAQLSQNSLVPQGSTSGPNAAVNAAIAGANQAQGGYTQALEGVAQGDEKAADALAGAIHQQAENLPYQDVLNTLLTQRKNELLYGSQPSSLQQVQTTSWSQPLQDVYKYLQGTFSGVGGAPGSSQDTLPSISGAAGQSGGTGISSGGSSIAKITGTG